MLEHEQQQRAIDSLTRALADAEAAHSGVQRDDAHSEARHAALLRPCLAVSRCPFSVARSGPFVWAT